MNHAIIGKPGGGKGMLSMHLILDDLRHSKRPVITDVAIEKEPWCTGSHEPRRGLLDYLREKHGQEFDAAERVFRLTTEAMQNFFLYRALNRAQVDKLGAAHLIGYREVTPLDHVLVESEWRYHKEYKLYVADHESHQDKRGRKIVDSWDTRLALASGGHLLIADEAWKQWPARGWATTGEGILYYYSMVRRFGDDNWIVTQRSNDVDSILMERCQDYWVCNNHGKLRFGFFRQPAVFVVSVYDHRPTPSSEPMHRKPFTLDRKGLAQCYDTSGGVGVAGRVMADTANKAAGLPFWAVFVIGGLGILALIFTVRGGQHFLSGILGGKKKVVAVQAAPEKPAAVLERAIARPAIPPKEPEKPKAEERKAAADESQGEEIYCTGYIILPDGPIVSLSDGSEWAGLADGVQSVSRKSVVIAGKSYPLRRYHPKQVDPGRGMEVPPTPAPVVSSAPVVTYQESKPVNQAIILPAIHAQGGVPPPRLNGFGAMNRQFSPGRQNQNQ